jgi:hypothetical protein
MLLPEGEPRWVSPCRTLLTEISFGWKKKSHEVRGSLLHPEVRGLRRRLRVNPQIKFYCRQTDTSSVAEQFVRKIESTLRCSKKGAIMPHDHNEDWRILAEEARLEKDPDKLLEIISALNRALDDREKDARENRQQPPATGPKTKDPINAVQANPAQPGSVLK